MVSLADRAHDACGTLSKELRQRVALARALLNDPEVLFLDEPTSGLDPVAGREVHELIDGLRRRGVTILLTTHRLEEAERLCDRVAILNTTLRVIGRPDELRDRLFTKTLSVKILDPLPEPDRVFADLPGLDSWRRDGPAGYLLGVSDTSLAAPAAVRALVAAGADVLSISEARHSLEDSQGRIPITATSTHARAPSSRRVAGGIREGLCTGSFSFRRGGWPQDLDHPRREGFVDDLPSARQQVRHQRNRAQLCVRQGRFRLRISPSGRPVTRPGAPPTPSRHRCTQVPPRGACCGKQCEEYSQGGVGVVETFSGEEESTVW